MTFFIGLLTFVMVIVSVALIFLVLIQLPKKEAGAGVAFGGGATDALFGAGSGNVLTAATKYAATAFFILAILVGLLQSKFSDSARRTTDLEKALQSQPAQPAPATTPTAPTAPTTPAPAAPAGAPAN
jgi:preprotein translocase subunit SecG